MVRTTTPPPPPRPILYSAWFCPYAQRVWSCLAYFQIEFDLIESIGTSSSTDVMNLTKHPDLLKVNPKGTVPTLVIYTDDNPTKNHDTNDEHDTSANLPPTIQCESLDIVRDLYEKHSSFSSSNKHNQDDDDDDDDMLEQLYQDAHDYNNNICSPFYAILMKRDEIGRQEAWKQMVDSIVAFSDHLEWGAPVTTAAEDFEEEKKETDEESGRARKRLKCISFYSAFHKDYGDNHKDPLLQEEEPSLVDFAIYPWIKRLCVIEHYRGYNLLQEEEVPRHVSDKIYAWKAKMESLPAIQQTLVEDKRLIEINSQLVDGKFSSASSK
mmetsp:Transcript_13668/g.21346  ORF Transcript_13668/g.21346 Transcript_13668/m.21346 type:complete len:324 (-) Transcript_13668:220-1191(-)